MVAPPSDEKAPEKCNARLLLVCTPRYSKNNTCVSLGRGYYRSRPQEQN